MVVATALLNGKLCAHTVGSTEDHFCCIWVTGPVPGLLSKEGRTVIRKRMFVRFSIGDWYHSSLSTTVNTRAATVDWPAHVDLFEPLFLQQYQC